ncbi:hypothetical protein [Microcoleus sp. D2_18a_B4]|uniref:hypothetical protein n=1 Tax=Microcoleus sp. D2_18a_B4 TaxID=3055329 RepID=UPI002FD330BD
MRAVESGGLPGNARSRSVLAEFRGYLSIRDRAKAIPISYLLWDKVPFYLIQ